MKHILIILALLPFCVSGQTTYSVDPIPEDTLVWFLQVDTVYGPDSTGIGDEVNIRKLRVTRAQARQILFTIADQQKQVLERQDEATRQFERSKQLLEQQGGADYDSLLADAVLRVITGKWTMQYQGKNFDAEANGPILTVGKTTYVIDVQDRNTVVIRGLMGGGKDVTLTIRDNALMGDYNNKRILFTRPSTR